MCDSTNFALPCAIVFIHTRYEIVFLLTHLRLQFRIGTSFADNLKYSIVIAHCIMNRTGIRVFCKLLFNRNYYPIR